MTYRRQDQKWYRCIKAVRMGYRAALLWISAPISSISCSHQVSDGAKHHPSLVESNPTRQPTWIFYYRVHAHVINVCKYIRRYSLEYPVHTEYDTYKIKSILAASHCCRCLRLYYSNISQPVVIYIPQMKHASCLTQHRHVAIMVLPEGLDRSIPYALKPSWRTRQVCSKRTSSMTKKISLNSLSLSNIIHRNFWWPRVERLSQVLLDQTRRCWFFEKKHSEILRRIYEADVYTKLMYIPHVPKSARLECKEKLWWLLKKAEL